MWHNFSAFNVRDSASKLNKASGSPCCVCIQKYREADRGSRLDDQFYTKWRRQRARDEIGPNVVSGGARLGPGFLAVHCGGISLFDYVEVMFSSSGLFICPRYLRADVIRGRCSGRSVVAPGVLHYVFTGFSLKDSCKKKACSTPTYGTHFPRLSLSSCQPALPLLPPDTLHNVLPCFKCVFFLCESHLFPCFIKNRTLWSGSKWGN